MDNDDGCHRMCFRNASSAGTRASSGEQQQSNNNATTIKCNNNQPISDSSNTGETRFRCLRCNTLYSPLHNSPDACSFHGHTTGEKGLYALAPPHQGVDREWTDASGVIVYKWNPKHERPNSGGPAKWRKRWSGCSNSDPSTPPCRRGFHVSYDDGFTLY